MHNFRIILFMVILTGVLHSCGDSITDEWVYLIDYTDKDMAKPNTQSIISRMNLDNPATDGVTMKRVAITGTHFGREDVVVLPSQESLSGNIFDRQIEEEMFRDSIDSLMNYGVELEDEYSVIFPVVVREVNRLVRVGINGRKSMVICSDLVENTEVISFAKMSMTDSKHEEMEELWEEMENHYDIRLADNLESLDITIAYVAKGHQDSQRFARLAELYKRKLEEKGAMVTISGTL